MTDQNLIGDKYILHEPIGEGGMGTVYRGTDIHTKTTVAVKSLKKDTIHITEELVERFAREGEALRQLNHPNIVKVLDTFNEGDQHYIVLEYMSGGSLRDVLKQRDQLPITQVLEIALDLADALTRAHRLNIIHRDIKPANVMLAEDGTPRLTDFGVARIGGTSQMTATGAVVGTLHYLSPEAINGERPDERSDIWAFGVLIYELLAGTRPFEADNAGMLLNSILNNKPDDILIYCRDLPQSVIDLLDWMLVKDPNKRIRSVRQIGAHLEAILENPDVQITQSHKEISKRFGETTPVVPPLVKELEETPIFHTDLPLPSSTEQEATPPQEKSSSVNPILVISALVVIGVIALLGVLSSNSALSPTNTPTQTNVASTPLPASTIPPPLASIDTKVHDYKYPILVMDFENVGGENRDLQRFIVDDLKTQLSAVPSAPYTVVSIPAIATNSAEAIQYAESVGATLVIWGNYDDELADVTIQAGDLRTLPAIEVNRDEVDQLTRVRLRLENPRRESLIFPVLSNFELLFLMNDDPFYIALNIVIADRIPAESPPMSDTTLANQTNLIAQDYIRRDYDGALGRLDDILEMNSGNGVLWLSRGVFNINVGNYTDALQDLETSEKFTSETYTSPTIMKSFISLMTEDDYFTARDFVLQAIEQDPDDSDKHMLVGILSFLGGDYEQALESSVTAIELGARFNFAYLIATSMYVRQAQFDDAADVMDEIVVRFPDVSLSRLLITSVFTNYKGNEVITSLGDVMGGTVLSQWSDVIETVDNLPEDVAPPADLYFAKGFAYCNLQEYDKAVEAYEQAIELDEDYLIAYVNLAEVRAQAGDLFGAARDMAQLAQRDTDRRFTKLIEVGTTAGITCENIFDYEDLPAISYSPED